MNTLKRKALSIAFLAPLMADPPAGGEGAAASVPSTPAAKAEAKAPAAKKAKPAKKPAAKAKAKKKGAPNKGAKAGKGLGTAAKGPAVLREYAPKYIKDTAHKTPSGNPSVHCGDPVAKKLLGKSLDEVYGIVAKATEETEKDLRKKYGGLNLGMQRMNLGNKLRGVLNAK